MPQTAPQPLAGLRILVTRPAAQADALCEAIAAHGGTPVRFPVMAIEALADTSALEDLADRLGTFDLAFFVSPNAVQHALRAILARRAWPAGVAVATVGKGSERALAEHGFTGVIAPDSGFDSEAVLALPAFAPEAVRGRRVVVFRGDGGRDLLGDTLRERGAEVEYVTCYCRALPPVEPALLQGLAERGELDAISLTSSEGVRNFLTLFGGELPPALARIPVFASHPRIAEQATLAGFSRVIATEPGDDGLLAALEAHFDTSLG
ncbi:uroporphyrinogen-III synthase [Pseudothauera rhizosphaerae]|uniref:Uroporphyrinogen-III synthase n=1 Tax=Pseudothauera rhizosphaerae TaxID=2565932 RepID=A0A4S4AXR5_9RHOO|nr:uroporphyrinogen-III synthase [Pseudothauera rhizosphaerae]THF64423.1 uroporphyrinogen-III synthase [Pseudothauera rhizosphaerae]